MAHDQSSSSDISDDESYVFVPANSTDDAKQAFIDVVGTSLRR